MKIRTLLRYALPICVLGIGNAFTLQAAEPPRRPEAKPPRSHRHLQPVFTREEFGKVDSDRDGWVSGEEFERAFMPDCTSKTCKIEMEKAWKEEYPWQDIKTHVKGADLAMWLKLSKTKGKTWGGSKPK